MDHPLYINVCDEARQRPNRSTMAWLGKSCGGPRPVHLAPEISKGRKPSRARPRLRSISLKHFRKVILEICHDYRLGGSPETDIHVDHSNSCLATDFVDVYTFSVLRIPNFAVWNWNKRRGPERDL